MHVVTDLPDNAVKAAHSTAQAAWTATNSLSGRLADVSMRMSGNDSQSRLPSDSKLDEAEPEDAASDTDSDESESDSDDEEEAKEDDLLLANMAGFEMLSNFSSTVAAEAVSRAATVLNLNTVGDAARVAMVEHVFAKRWLTKYRVLQREKMKMMV